MSYTTQNYELATTRTFHQSDPQSLQFSSDIPAFFPYGHHDFAQPDVFLSSAEAAAEAYSSIMDPDFQPTDLVSHPLAVTNYLNDIFNPITLQNPQQDGIRIHGTVHSILCDIPEAKEEPVMDKRSLATIVKAECLALVGAHFFKVKKLRNNGTVCYLDKHTLPGIAESGDPPRYGSTGQLLHSPNWILGVRHNSGFFNAVAAAVRQVHAEAITVSTDRMILQATHMYFRQMVRNYTVQATSMRRGVKENIEAAQLSKLRNAKFEAKLSGLY